MKSISRILLFTFLVTEVTSFNVSVEKLSTLFLPYTYSPSEIYDLGEDAAEQMVYDPPTKLLYSVGHTNIHVIDLTDVNQMRVLYNVSYENVDVTDVEICGSFLFVSMDNETKRENGFVNVYEAYNRDNNTLELLHQIIVGALPDMIHPTSDCRRVIVAIEAEPYDTPSGFVDPPGGVGLIKFNDTPAGNYTYSFLGFEAFNSRYAELEATGVRFVYRGNNNTLSNDLEPEYIALNRDETKAYVCLQLLITLRYLAKGDFFSEIADLHGVSRSSVCRSIKQVVSSIDKNLENIKFPTTVHDVAQTKLGFYQLSGVPNVIGAVDGTQIQIMAPSKDENIYICRKGYHSINIQAIVDSKLRFTNINARWPGSTHDSAVFDSCSVKQWLEEVKPGWLLGDSGYPLCPYLMTPILNPQNDKETRFNVLHSRARVCVERAFGILKERFRCLHKSGGCLPFTPAKCMQIVSVCAKLHNLCMELNLPLDVDEGENANNNNDDDDDEAFNGPNNRTAVEIRQSLVDML